MIKFIWCGTPYRLGFYTMKGYFKAFDFGPIRIMSKKSWERYHVK